MAEEMESALEGVEENGSKSNESPSETKQVSLSFFLYRFYTSTKIMFKCFWCAYLHVHVNVHVPGKWMQILF